VRCLLPRMMRCHGCGCPKAHTDWSRGAASKSQRILSAEGEGVEAAQLYVHTSPARDQMDRFESHASMSHAMGS
jgi:hypothetical protein